MNDLPDRTGGCLCGNIRYTLKAAPRAQFICHCKMCQRSSGSAFAPVLTMASKHVEITKGRPRSYKSSVQGERQFCETCGSPVFIRRFARPEVCGVYAGSLDENSFKPQAQICTSSAVSWLDTSKLAPGYPEKPPGGNAPLVYDPVTGRTHEQ